MAKLKRVLQPQRLRRVPPRFSWVDQRLVRAGFIERCDPPAAALYLFLVTVADAQGLSYYGEAGLCRQLQLSPAQLCAARERLIAADLIAFEAPLYQVLALPAATGTVEPAPAQAVVSALERAQVQLHLQQLRTQLRRAP